MNFKAMLFPPDYFQWLLGFLKAFGLYPPKHNKRKIVYYIFYFPHITLTMLSIVLDFLNILLNQETVSRKMLNVGVLFLHTASGLRLLSWLWTKNKFEDVIGIIQRPDFDFKIFMYDDRRRTIESKRTSIDVFRKFRLRRTNLVCCGIFLMVVFYIFMNIFVTYICNGFKETYERFNERLNTTSTYRDFPYPMWFPFDTSVSDGHYFLALFYQPYAYCNLMVSFWCIDWLVLSSIIHLQNQLTVLSFALGEVDKNMAGISVERVSSVRRIRLTKCIEELNEIIRAAGLIEKLCNNQLLVQNILATFVFCTLLYVITTLTITTEITSISSATGIILLEPLVQCWVCQDFTLEFSKILQRLYELDWVDYPPNLRIFLIMTMIRVQNPPVFTLGKWRVIKIPFYIHLLKMTYSFYTLISCQTSKTK